MAAAYSRQSISFALSSDDEDSWGYRMQVAANYSGLFGGLNMTPFLSFTHDVDGTTPGTALWPNLTLPLNLDGCTNAFYGATITLWALGIWLYRPDPVALLALLPVALHLLWQVATLDPQDPANPLDRFRSNRWAGALMAAACFIVGNAYAGTTL